MSAKRDVREFRAPDEAEAQERAWAVVRAAHRAQAPAAGRRSRRRLAVIPGLAILVAALALSPAGATVRRWINHELGVRPSAPRLFSLPAAGRVLVSGSGGTWIVNADGSARRLGPWRQASWSPHGWFVAVAGRDELAAVDPDGTMRWTLARPAVSDPRWYPPLGYRIAYLSGADLRVVMGDGEGDHLVDTGIASVAPAWRPDHPYQLAYVTRRGTLVVRDADSGRIAWRAHIGGALTLAWSADGERLLVLARARASVYGATGRLLTTLPMAADAPILTGSLSPDGHTVALVRGGAAGDVVLANLESSRPRLRPVLPGAGLRELAWSPDGHWLLVSWPAANEWVFVRVAGGPRIAAVSGIAAQFGSGASPGAFPRLEGWCCTTPGAAG